MASDDISANTNLINKGDPQMPANCLPSNMQKNNFTPNLDPKFKVLKVLLVQLTAEQATLFVS